MKQTKLVANRFVSWVKGDVTDVIGAACRRVVGVSRAAGRGGGAGGLLSLRLGGHHRHQVHLHRLPPALLPLRHVSTLRGCCRHSVGDVTYGVRVRLRRAGTT